MTRENLRPHDLAVIVVSANDGCWLERCLRTVFDHAGDISLDVIVIDNESTDGTRAIVEESFPQARVLSSPNRGFGYGNNRGWEESDARYALFLNPDTEILDGTLAELLDLLDERTDIGLGGVRQVTADRTVYPSMRRFPNAARALGEALFAESWPFHPSWSGERVLDLDAYEQDRSCDWTVGAFMIARREALLSAGIMDERFFLQSEEPDLCLRMRRAGWDIRHLPTMTIIHHAGKARRSPRMAAQDAYARRQYAYKHFSVAHRRAYLAALWLRYLIRSGLPGHSDTAHARRAAARGSLRALARPAVAPFMQPPSTAMAVRRLGTQPPVSAADIETATASGPVTERVGG